MSSQTEVEPQIIYFKPFTGESFHKHAATSLQLPTELQQSIQANWQDFANQVKAKGGKVWDGTYYRLEKFDPSTNLLKLSTIKYSEIRGLNHDNEMVGLEFVEANKLVDFLSDKASYRPLTAKLYQQNIGPKVI